MKKIIYFVLTIFVMTLYSCAFDNLDEPDAAIHGKIIDETTGQNFIMSSQGLQIRMWEISYNDNPSPRNLNVKDDGTYNNSKLFSGTYKVLPSNGAFWPVKDTTTIELKSGKDLELNFTVTPYLKISIVDHKLDGRRLTIRGKIEAPITENLPRVLDIRPFVALTKFVGAANITQYSDKYRIDINKSFTDGVGTQIYTITINEDLPAARTFYVRLGARVDDSYKANNYSEIIEIKVP